MRDTKNVVCVIQCARRSRNAHLQPGSPPNVMHASPLTHGSTCNPDSIFRPFQCASQCAISSESPRTVSSRPIEFGYTIPMSSQLSPDRGPADRRIVAHRPASGGFPGVFVRLRLVRSEMFTTPPRVAGASVGVSPLLTQPQFSALRHETRGRKSQWSTLIRFVACKPYSIGFARIECAAIASGASDGSTAMQRFRPVSARWRSFARRAVGHCGCGGLDAQARPRSAAGSGRPLAVGA